MDTGRVNQVLSAMYGCKTEIKTVTEKLNRLRSELAILSCPYKVGDKVMIPNDGRSTGRGRHMIVTEVRHDFKVSDHPIEFVWVAYGSILDRDDLPTGREGTLHMTAKDFLDFLFGEMQKCS